MRTSYYYLTVILSLGLLTSCLKHEEPTFNPPKSAFKSTKSENDDTNSGNVNSVSVTYVNQKIPRTFRFDKGNSFLIKWSSINRFRFQCNFSKNSSYDNMSIRFDHDVSNSNWGNLKRGALVHLGVPKSGFVTLVDNNVRKMNLSTPNIINVSYRMNKITASHIKGEIYIRYREFGSSIIREDRLNIDTQSKDQLLFQQY